MKSKDQVGGVNGGSCPSVPCSEPETGSKKGSRGRTPQASLPGYGDSHWSREGRGWIKGNTSFLDTLPHPQQRSPLVGKEDLRRRCSQKAYPWSWPLGSHQPWPPAAVFLIEARCGPDALGGSRGAGPSQAAFQDHCPHTSTGTVPAAGRGWEPPTLFPGLLTEKPL